VGEDGIIFLSFDSRIVYSIAAVSLDGWMDGWMDSVYLLRPVQSKTGYPSTVVTKEDIFLRKNKRWSQYCEISDHKWRKKMTVKAINIYQVQRPKE
jgi:hypothetical protein